MSRMYPPVGPNSRHLLPGSDFASLTTGKNDPNRAGAHLGSDFQPVSPGNSDPIYWIEDGVITRIVRNRAKGSTAASLYSGHSGNAVEYTGQNGRVWHYRHMPAWAMVNLKVGQKVVGGALATYMGTTGNSNGVHLHLGLRINGVFVDPEEVLRDNGAWPLGNPFYKTHTISSHAAPVKKEWSELATEKEVASAAQAAILDVLTKQKLVSWRDSASGKTNKISIAQALGNFSLHWDRESKRDSAEVRRDEATIRRDNENNESLRAALAAQPVQPEAPTS